MSLLSVSEAVARLVSALEPVGSDCVSLEDALHRVLYQDLISPANYPRFDNSSMDGFAVRSQDVMPATASNPVQLRITEDIPAGSQPQTVIATGYAARIMTGAPLPVGADAVVPVEDTDLYDHTGSSSAPSIVHCFKAVQPRDNVRPVGQDIAAGQLVLSKGRRLRAPDVALFAMLGIAEVNVFTRPKVAILSNGDELQMPGETLQPGKVFDSNSNLLVNLVRIAGGDVVFSTIAQDTAESVINALNRAVNSGANIIISSAGVSVGAFDYMRQVIEANGEMNFWRVNMRPGKPLAFGAYHDVPVVGLPGNPVSAYVGFKVFLNPALMKLSGLTPQPPLRVKASLAADIESDGRETYFRAIITEESDTLTASLTGHQGSGNLLSLVQANALLIVPSGVKSLPAGTYVDVWLLDD